MERRRPISELMTGDFTVAETRDPETGITVLVDDDGAPAGLVRAGQAGPAHVVEADTPVTDVLDSADLLHALVSGTPGLVIVREGGIVGVVTAEAIKAEIVDAASSGLVSGPQLGDAQPYGRRTEVGSSRIRCAECGKTNTFRRFSQAGRYKCQYGDHDFVPYWNG
ncbi:hypothetical protein AB0K60_04625 [Thermopolyspora sp. NPDC052614]|uniref:hypothetical protein n=1 Tax=Thermopolyspora sp. NPDC052614 TaxID=3155682 RepID=UPI00341584D0